MLMLIFAFVLLFVGLAVVLYMASLWWQGYFYERPADGLAWRSTAAAGVITAWFVGWAMVHVKSPGKFESLFNFTVQDVREFDQFWSERKSDIGPTETLFRRRMLPSGRQEFTADDGRRWQRSDSGIVTAIIIDEDGERKRFAAKLAPDGNFIRDPSDSNRAAEVEYIEEGGGGRKMTESTVGRLTSTRYGALFMNLLFNFVFAVVWFAVLWLLLEFQPWHAILLAGIFWLAGTTLLWPAVQSRVAEWRAGIAIIQ